MLKIAIDGWPTNKKNSLCMLAFACAVLSCEDPCMKQLGFPRADRHHHLESIIFIRRFSGGVAPLHGPPQAGGLRSLGRSVGSGQPWGTSQTTRGSLNLQSARPRGFLESTSDMSTPPSQSTTRLRELHTAAGNFSFIFVMGERPSILECLRGLPVTKHESEVRGANLEFL